MKVLTRAVEKKKVYPFDNLSVSWRYLDESKRQRAITYRDPFGHNHVVYTIRSGPPKELARKWYDEDIKEFHLDERYE